MTRRVLATRDPLSDGVGDLRRVTSAPVLVSEVHSASGPGFNVYACDECAQLFPKLADALDLLATGWRDRAENEQ